MLLRNFVYEVCDSYLNPETAYRAWCSSWISSVILEISFMVGLSLVECDAVSGG